MNKKETNWIKGYYLSNFISSISQGMISPFISIFALKLGADFLRIGFLLSIPSLVSTIIQILWARITVNIGKRKIFVVFSGIVNSIFWLIMGFCTNSNQLIVLMGIQATLSAIGAPAGSGLITELLPNNLRGRIIANTNKYATIGIMLGTIFAGPLLDSFPFRTGYILLFLIASIVNLLGTFTFYVSVPDVEVKVKEKGLENVRAVLNNKNLINLTILRSLFTISVTIAAPYFNVYLVEKYKASNTIISYLSIASNLFSIATLSLWGGIVDKYGRVLTLTLGSALTSLIPIVYVISNNILFPLSSQIISGTIWSLVNVALSAYLMDITYDKNIEVSVALFNASMGLSNFIGPIIGGAIVSLTGSIDLIFFMSGILRVLTSLPSYKLLEEVHHVREIRIESISLAFSGIHHDAERGIRRFLKAIPFGESSVIKRVEEKIEELEKEEKWEWIEEF